MIWTLQHIYQYDCSIDDTRLSSNYRKTFGTISIHSDMLSTGSNLQPHSSLVLKGLNTCNVKTFWFSKNILKILKKCFSFRCEITMLSHFVLDYIHRKSWRNVYLFSAASNPKKSVQNFAKRLTLSRLVIHYYVIEKFLQDFLKHLLQNY